LIKTLAECGVKSIEEKSGNLIADWEGKIVVTHVHCMKAWVTGQEKDRVWITLPIPEGISKKLVITHMNIYLDAKLRIAHVYANGTHPHGGSGNSSDLSGICVGDSVGLDIVRLPEVIRSLSVANAGSFGNERGASPVKEYVTKLQRAYLAGEDLSDFGLDKDLQAVLKDDEAVFGSTWGTERTKGYGGDR
jgi:hypothetical protein